LNGNALSALSALPAIGGTATAESPNNTVQKKKQDWRLVYCHVCKIRHDLWECAKCATGDR
jgi:recombinational DNA repair protein RecR